MTLYKYNGKYLKRDNKYATANTCCCDGGEFVCCAGTPDELQATFTKLTGGPCPNLDGLVVDMPFVDDADPHQEWKGVTTLGNGEDLDIELKCDAANSYNLEDLQRIWGTVGTVTQVSGSCYPFEQVYEISTVHHQHACEDIDDEFGPYKFRVTIVAKP